MIPAILIDRSTVVKNHTFWTHLFCVGLRILIGSTILMDMWSLNAIRLLALLVFAMFTYKFLYGQKPIWKVYARTALTYFLIAVLVTVNALSAISNLTTITGILIIVDAMMGLQSRKLMSNLGDVLAAK